MDTRLRTLIVVLLAGLALQAEDRFRLMPDASGQIPYFIGPAANKSGYRSTDEDLVVWALQEWERSVNLLRFRRVEDEHTARVRVQWLPWAEDAALGRMEPSSDEGRPVASLIIRPDENKFRPTVRRRVKEDPLMRDVVLYYVCLHEVGHALGLSHSDNPRDIMWPGANGVTLPIYDRYRHHLMTRDDIPRVSWLSHDDIVRVTDLWARP
jgi:Matrixin